MTEQHGQAKAKDVIRALGLKFPTSPDTVTLALATRVVDLTDRVRALEGQVAKLESERSPSLLTRAAHRLGLRPRERRL